jgi:RNA polymerase sigma factor (sigma-70 family)
VLRREETDRTDGQLLEHFVSRRDEAALEGLVRRHGPMVWGVCRRILRHEQDAEDAFQAAFLVLVRRAASIVPRELVGNWLYGVAQQTALKARATAARRRHREGQRTSVPEPAAMEQAMWPDLQPLLDLELSRLSEKYRTAVVLCELEGRSRKEVARQLGLPEGTVASRLTRARALLAKRLTQRGLAPSAVALTAAFVQNASAAPVPSHVLTSTIRATSQWAAGHADHIPAPVAALTEGVLKAMLVKKLKVTTAVLLGLCLAGLGAGAAAYQASGAERPTPKRFDSAAAAGQEKALKPGSDKGRIQGKWRMVKAEWDGIDQTGTLSGESYYVFKEDTIEAVGDNTSQRLFYRLDATTKPKEFDFAYLTESDAIQNEAEKRGPFKAVYELDGDTLKICYALVGKPRPTEFATQAGQKAAVRLLVFEREKGKKKP